MEHLYALSRECPRFAQSRIWALLRRNGVVVNRNAVERLWRRLGLQRRPRRKNVRSGDFVPPKAEHLNHFWAYDFVFGWTLGGGSVQPYNPDQRTTLYNREGHPPEA